MNQILETISNEQHTPLNQEFRKLSLDSQQSNLLHRLATEIAKHGSPQPPGTRKKALSAATEFKITLNQEQVELLNKYKNGQISALVIDGMAQFSATHPPKKLPSLSFLENDLDTIKIGIRSQILLKLVNQSAFAYDIDNDSKLLRVVANVEKQPFSHASPSTLQTLSSHSGLALGPHTEGPYWCVNESDLGHSPAPSSLILSALWNPGSEPTSVIPLPRILDSLGVETCLALTTPWFQFTRTDSFVDGMGEGGQKTAILSHSATSGFSVKFNSYRFTAMKEAPASVKKALDFFMDAIKNSLPLQHVLSQKSAIIINNTRALHCRDIIKDNRRTLIRLFAYSEHAKPITYSDDPFLVRG